MKKIIGRKQEILFFEQTLKQKEAQFIAVWGRRRVGKTYLIEEYFQPKSDIYLQITGMKDESFERQLEIFRIGIQEVFFKNASIPKFENWTDAFRQLIACLRALEGTAAKVVTVFIDELPWLATKNSKIINALDHAWNTELKKFNFLKLIVCGSAASWIIDNIIDSTGGLHNRITGQVHLKPFTLRESLEFLKSRNIEYSKRNMIDIYLAFGGIPYYLKLIREGESPTQAVARLCFLEKTLHDEFDKLYKSLFSDSSWHYSIINALASRNYGLTRQEIIELLNKNTSTVQSSGFLSKKLEELEYSGFISKLESVPINKPVTYRITDLFTNFHLKWIKPVKKGALNSSQAAENWMQIKQSQKYSVWSGFAFEVLCFSHLKEIRKALGLENTICLFGVFNSQSKTDKKKHPDSPSLAENHNLNTQIDLVIDRNDGVISLCEIKNYNTVFSLTAEYCKKLDAKKAIFKKHTKTKKDLHTVLITIDGITNSELKNKYIQAQLTCEDLL